MNGTGGTSGHPGADQGQARPMARHPYPLDSGMEEALFITQLELLEAWNPRFSRLYFGIEFCQNLIPAPAQVKQALEFARSKRAGFTLVTPYVTDCGLDRLRPIFNLLAQEAPDAEITVNDWGVLRLLHREYSFPALNFGRLLTKMKRDPRLGTMIHAFPPRALANFRDCHLSVPEVRRFLAGLGIRRLEFDNLLQGLSLSLAGEPAMMTNSLYYPYGYITTTRLCKVADLRNGPERLILRVIESCPQTCRDYRVHFNHQNLREPIMAQGSTFFYQNRQLPLNTRENGINRLIIQPEIPMPLNSASS